jgi:hypothetical protein
MAPAVEAEAMPEDCLVAVTEMAVLGSALMAATDQAALLVLPAGRDWGEEAPEPQVASRADSGWVVAVMVAVTVVVMAAAVAAKDSSRPCSPRRAVHTNHQSTATHLAVRSRRLQLFQSRRAHCTRSSVDSPPHPRSCQHQQAV